jgi:hypothetical protein
MLSFTNPFALSVIILSVVMLSVVMLSVVHFYPILVYAGEARNLSLEWSLIRGSTLVHTSLFYRGVSDEKQKFNKPGTWLIFILKFSRLLRGNLFVLN